MNPAHLHLALVHIPVLFVPLALFILMGGIWLKKQSLISLALGLFVFSALVAIPSFLSGEPAEEIVEELPLVSEPVIEAHEEAAEIAFYLSLIAGSLALGSIFLMKKEKLKKPLLAGVLVMGSASSIALLRAANLGGQIRHSEIRSQLSLDKTQEESDNDD